MNIWAAHRSDCIVGGKGWGQRVCGHCEGGAQLGGQPVLCHKGMAQEALSISPVPWVPAPGCTSACSAPCQRHAERAWAVSQDKLPGPELTQH